MDLAPSVVTPELAVAALTSPVLADAVRLAGWIGGGKEVTSDGVLPPALAREACELLGVQLPEDIQDDEVYSETLDVVWEAAEEAGFITVNDELAVAAELPTDPDEVLHRWLRVILVPFGVPDQPCGECVTILAVLDDSPEPVSVQTLFEAVLSDFPSADEDTIDMESVDHTAATIFALRDLGAVSITELGDPEKNLVRLTPLGRMLTDTVFTTLTPAPDEMAGEVAYRFGHLSPRIAAKIAGPWLASRTTADAARELLDFATYARADLRMVATAFVSTLGAEAAPAWQERVKDRGVGVYARSWLSEHGENMHIDARDADWCQVEEFSAHMATVPEHVLVALLAEMRRTDPDALQELRRALNASRHPDAPKLMDALAQVTGRSAAIAARDLPAVSSAPTGTVCQLRISLRYVENPAVWRTVAVDTGTTLADLHEIIQAAMGWGDDHLHGFAFGRAEVRETAPLGRLLRKPGDTILYTYDFGDDWEHDITVEDFSHNGGGVTLPALIDGSGACPPEDCGGAPGFRWLKEIMADPDHEEHDKMADWLGASSFDPAGFTLATAAAAVARIAAQRSSAADRRPVAIVRVQPRRKKRRG